MGDSVIEQVGDCLFIEEISPHDIGWYEAAIRCAALASLVQIPRHDANPASRAEHELNVSGMILHSNNILKYMCFTCSRQSARDLLLN